MTLTPSFQNWLSELATFERPGLQKKVIYGMERNKMKFDVEGFRGFFPQLKRKKGPSPIIYFDNAASTLKLDQVIDRVNHFNRF